MAFDTKLKQWTSLGLGTVLMTGALTGCGEAAAPADETGTEISQPETPAATAPDADVNTLATEGGEGEGGVTIDAAYTDPVVFKSALAIAAAHVLAARDAFIAGETSAAAEMYAHPVSEVLFDMAPVFEAQGVADFTDLFTDTSAAVFAGESQDEISARTDKILAALDKAAERAPGTDLSDAMVSARVASDQIDRASDMYRLALDSDFYETYLDGYGFFQAAKRAFSQSEAAIEAENADAADAIRNALDLMGAAYPTALRPDPMEADASELAVAASEVQLALSQ
ncbi:MAG: hypothetical protein R3265_04790 [Hyphomonas sp.]|nr:hypothetical protein [Hyphomonas sp.]